MAEYIENPLSGKLRGVTYEDGKIIDVHIRDTDDVVKVFVPVRHGRWELSKKYVGYCSCSLCSDCYVEPEWVDRLHWRFCPNCGAKMECGNDG